MLEDVTYPSYEWRWFSLCYLRIEQWKEKYFNAFELLMSKVVCACFENRTMEMNIETSWQLCYITSPHLPQARREGRSADSTVGATSTNIGISCNGDLGLGSSLGWRWLNYGELTLGQSNLRISNRKSWLLGTNIVRVTDSVERRTDLSLLSMSRARRLFTRLLCLRHSWLLIRFDLGWHRDKTRSGRKYN